MIAGPRNLEGTHTGKLKKKTEVALNRTVFDWQDDKRPIFDGINNNYIHKLY